MLAGDDLAGQCVEPDLGPDAGAGDAASPDAAPLPDDVVFRIGGSDYDQANAVAVAPDGSIVIAGGFRGGVDFGEGSVMSAGNFDVFVAKYTTKGALVWARHFGASEMDMANAVAIDKDGNIAIAILFTGNVDFGTGLQMSAGEADMALLKLDPNGTSLWAKRFGSLDFDNPQAVAIDEDGAVYLAGTFGKSVSFGGSVLNASAGNIAVAKYAGSNGAHIWSRQMGNAASEMTGALSVRGGLVIVGGSVGGMANFGGGNTSSTSNLDGFLAAYTASAGSFKWARRHGGASPSDTLVIADLELSADGAVYACGMFAGSAKVGTAEHTSAGANDVIISKIDTNGAPIWSTAFGGTQEDQCAELAIYENRVVVAGIFEGVVEMGTTLHTSAGGRDGYMVVLDSAGTYGASVAFGGTNFDDSYGLAAGKQAVVVGPFQGTATYGAKELMSGGFVDSYVFAHAFP